MLSVSRSKAAYSLLILLVGLLLLLPRPALAGPAAAPAPGPAAPPRLLDRSNYVPTLLELFNGARESIYVSQYLIVPVDRGPNDSVFCLMVALAAAVGRGLEVHVALEGSGSRLTQNKPALDYFRENGLDAYFESPDITNHEKTVVVDRRWVVVGSSNWTRPALDLNRETNLLVDSPALAGELIENFPRPYQPGVKFPISLFDNSGFRKLFEDHAERQFDLYLLLVKQAQAEDSSSGVVAVDRTFLARGLGYDETAPAGQAGGLTAKDLWRFLDSLAQDQKLIKTDRAGSRVALAGYPELWRSECFEIPLAYWQYGYDRDLSFRAKYFYLISLAETKQSRTPPWWWRSLEDLSAKYGLNVVSLDQAAGELEVKNIEEIYREIYLGGRQEANEYCLNPLLSPAEKQAAWQALETRFGAARVARARRQAEVLNDPNDPVLVRRLIFLEDQYGRAKMDAALAKLKTYSPASGRRQIRYLVGILQSD